MKTLSKTDIENKTVIIRCDFNVPIKDGKIIDDTRIKASLDTIRYCLKQNCKIILMSHLGRVKDEADLNKNNLEPVSVRLGELLGKNIIFIPETRGDKINEAISQLNPQDIVLMQNTRYEDLEGKKESKNDEELGKYWASLGDVFINDAFGTAHRAHASNVGIASHIPSTAGFLIEKEVDALSILNNPDKPFVVILGGAKVSDKIGVIENLVTKADKILIGGGMAFTFLKAKGFEIGTSLLDEENIEFCQKIMSEYPDKIILPIDVAVTTEYSEREDLLVKDVDAIGTNEMGLDIGPKSLSLFQDVLTNAKLVVWNGPVGVYEFEKYKKSTEELLKYLAKNNIKTIIGGGDTAAAAASLNLKDHLYHISTGGGATLEFLEGKNLPGIEALK